MEEGQELVVDPLAAGAWDDWFGQIRTLYAVVTSVYPRAMICGGAALHAAAGTDWADIDIFVDACCLATPALVGAMMEAFPTAHVSTSEKEQVVTTELLGKPMIQVVYGKWPFIDLFDLTCCQFGITRDHVYYTRDADEAARTRRAKVRCAAPLPSRVAERVAKYEGRGFSFTIAPPRAYNELFDDYDLGCSRTWSGIDMLMRCVKKVRTGERYIRADVKMRPISRDTSVRYVLLTCDCHAAPRPAEKHAPRPIQFR